VRRRSNKSIAETAYTDFPFNPIDHGKTRVSQYADSEGLVEVAEAPTGFMVIRGDDEALSGAQLRPGRPAMGGKIWVDPTCKLMHLDSICSAAILPKACACRDAGEAQDVDTHRCSAVTLHSGGGPSATNRIFCLTTQCIRSRRFASAR
jgi:hypothetical protein